MGSARGHKQALLVGVAGDPSTVCAHVILLRKATGDHKKCPGNEVNMNKGKSDHECENERGREWPSVDMHLKMREYGIAQKHL